MDQELKKVIFVFLMMVFIVVIGYIYNELGASTVFSGNVINSNYAGTSDFTVSELLEKKPYDQQVKLSGQVEKILEDYTSKKGYIYQQFMVSDEKNSILIFCSTYKGKKDVGVGENITFEGKFQKFGNKLEVYGYCNEVVVE